VNYSACCSLPSLWHNGDILTLDELVAASLGCQATRVLNILADANLLVWATIEALNLSRLNESITSAVPEPL
jgi:hypothetical protein